MTFALRRISLIDLLRRHAEDFGRDRRVHVAAVLEYLYQLLIAGESGCNTQLDLRIVYRDQARCPSLP